MPRYDQQLSLAGKRALVCGAGRGLGKAIAEGLVEAGAGVAIVSRTRSAAALAAELTQGGGKAVAFSGDMTSSADVDAVVARAIDALGRIDILVNVVGGNLRKPLVDTTDEDWDRSVRSNLTSVFYACRAAGRAFLAQGGGCVINIASTAGLRGRPNISSYCATKAAVINFSRALAIEWAPQRIRVNVLCPGRFRTDATAPEMDDPKKYAEFIKLVPLRRIGSPHEIKAAAVYLASDASAFATGSVLVLDGGQTVL